MRNTVTIYQVEPYKPDKSLLDLLRFYRRGLRVISSRIVEKGFGTVVKQKILNFKIVKCEVKQYLSPLYRLHIYTNTTVGMACSDILHNSLRLGKPVVAYVKLSESENYAAIYARWIPRNFKIVNPIKITIDPQDGYIMPVDMLEAKAAFFLRKLMELDSQSNKDLNRPPSP